MIKTKNNIITLTIVTTFLLIPAIVFGITFEGPVGFIPNQNPQPDKFVAPTTGCDLDQFISFNQADTPNYKCIDDRTSVSFTDVLRRLSDDDQLNSSNPGGSDPATQTEDLNALCGQNKFLVGFENGKIKCENVSFVGITGFCVSGTAVSGVDIVSGQKLYVCKSADNILKSSNIILDKALHDCETGNLIESKNKKLQCKEFVFESSYDPKFILQEEIITFRDIVCKNTKGISSIINTEDVVILTGFADNEYSSDNLNQAQTFAGSLPEVTKDFIGETPLDEKRQISTKDGVITFNGKEDVGGEYLSVSDTDWSEVESISLWTKQEGIERLNIILEISDNGGGAGKLDINLGNSDFFGESIFFSNNMLFVGAPGDDDGYINNGAVYLFEKDSNGVWSKTFKISENGGGAGKLDIDLNHNDDFGGSLSYLDNVLFVGAQKDDDGGDDKDKGAVYVFEKDSNGVWSKTLKISDNGGGNGKLDINLNDFDNFGTSVSYSNNTLVVGAVGEGTSKGAVYIFEKDSSGVWSQTLKISDNGGGAGKLDVNLGAYDLFGQSIFFSNNMLFVGSVRDTRKGAVYVFEKDSSDVWSQTLKISDNGGGAGLLDIDLDDFDQFGLSVTYSDNTLFVGALLDDDGGEDKGAIYAFEKDSSDVWSQTLKISDNGGGDGKLDVNLEVGSLGRSVSYLDGTLVIGTQKRTYTSYGETLVDGGPVYITELILAKNTKSNPVFTFGSEGKNVALDFREDATNNDEPSIYFDVASDVKTDTTVDVGLYIPTAGKSWNHVVIVNRGGGVADIYRNNEFVGRKKINDFPGLLSGFIGRNSTDISNVSIKELVVTKEELTDEQITSLYNHGIGIKNIQNNSLFCDLSDFDISAGGIELF